MTISTDNNNPTSIPYDGVLTVYRPYSIDINTNYASPFEYTIKKNDLVSCSATGGYSIQTYARYYKKRDYSNR